MSEETPLSPADAFAAYFDVDLALTPETRAQVFGVRYRVYCEEFGYEECSAFPDGQERDHYDAVSLHCLITHRGSGRPAGCVRLVPADASPEIRLLPLEEHCASSLDRELLDSLALDRATMCEISRLAVDGQFRRRAGESVSRFGASKALDVSQQEERSFSLISVAAFLAGTALTELSGRHNVLAMMEPFLPRMLERSGIHFRRIGADIDYHGMRAPYLGRTYQDGLATMRPELKQMYEMIQARIRSQFEAIARVGS